MKFFTVTSIRSKRGPGHTVQIYIKNILPGVKIMEKKHLLAASAIIGKKFSQIGIDRTHLQNNRKENITIFLTAPKS